MRFLIATIAVVVLGILVCYSFGGDSSQQLMQGELRCEGAGGIIINVDGTDYAVNGMAGRRASLQSSGFGTRPLIRKLT